MIISKNDDREVLPTDVIGRSVAHSKRWLVAIVRIYHEKKTSERLTKMGVENFLPIQQEVHKWSDRRKVVDRVVLPPQYKLSPRIKVPLKVSVGKS